MTLPFYGNDHLDAGEWADTDGVVHDGRINGEVEEDTPASAPGRIHLRDRLPGCSVEQRNTLVIVQNDGWTNLDDSAQSIKVVLDVIRTSDGLEGLTRPEVVHLAEAHSVSRSSTYVAVKALVDNGSIRNIGTDKRARYVAASTWGIA
jgi:hypothetical protein